MPATFSIADLYEAVDHAETRIAPLRQLRVEAEREYLGRFGGSRDDRTRRPLNLVQRGVKVLVAHMAGRNPRYEAKTERMALRGQARKLSKQLEIRAQKAGMAKFSRLCLLDAFLGGKCTVRVGERSSAEAIRNNDRFTHRGEVSRRRVSLDQWIFDPSARDDSEAFFEGERYRMPRAQALAAVEQGVFGYDATQEDGETPPLDEVATPDEAAQMIQAAPSVSDGRSRRWEERAEDLTGGTLSDHQRFGLIDTIELIDLALYIDAQTCILVTMMAEKGAAPKYLRAEIWDGPSKGPYEHLEFDPIPDNPHGPSVVAGMREQSELANTVLGKMANQIERTRRVLAYQKQRAADALKISKAPDGSTVGIDGPVSDIKDIDLGGVSPELVPFAQMIIGYWNMQGNYDQLGGQGNVPGASDPKTATQASLLATAASVLVDDLNNQFDDFQTALVQHEAWYLLHDPFIVAPMTMRMPGGFEMETVYNSLQRQGDFADFNFRIKPRSMQPIDPNVRSQRVIQLIGAVLEAAQAAMATQGLIDPAAVARILGHEFEVEELDEILRDPMLQAQLADVYGPIQFEGQGQPAGQNPGLGQADYRAMPTHSGGASGPGAGAASGRTQRQAVLTSGYSPLFAAGRVA